MATIQFKNVIAHFRKICTHKYWVARYCFKCGLYWQGLTHDLSKFSPVEFWESVKYYQGTSSPITAAKKDQGYSLAWQHHKGRNPHHYEYWTDRYDDGTVALQMPYKYATELICDWLGAARAYLGDEFSYTGEWNWWMNKIQNDHPKINPMTANYITVVFRLLMLREMTWKYHNVPDCLFEKHLPEIYKISEKYDGNNWGDIWDEIATVCNIKL